MKLLKLAVIWILFAPALVSAQDQVEERCWSEAKLLFQKGETQKAYNVLQKLPDTCAKRPECLKLMGDVYLELDSPVLGLVAYKTIQHLYPESPYGYKVLGTFFKSVRRRDLAIKEYEKGFQSVTDDTDRMQLIVDHATLYNQTRRFDEAASELESLDKRFPENKNILIELGAAYSGQKKFEKALRVYQKLSQIFPKSSIVFTNLGDVYQSLEQYKTAEPHLLKAIELNPKNSVAYSNLGYGKFKMGDLAGGMKNTEKAIELDPDDCYPYRNRGLIYIEMKEPEKACRSFLLAEQKGYTEMYADDVKELIRQYCK